MQGFAGPYVTVINKLHFFCTSPIRFDYWGSQRGLYGPVKTVYRICMQSWFHAPAAIRGFQILVTVTYTTLFPVIASRDGRCNCNKEPRLFNSAGTSADKTVVEGGGWYTNLRDHNFSRYAAIEH